MPQLHVSAAAPVGESPHQPECSPWSLLSTATVIKSTLVDFCFEKCAVQVVLSHSLSLTDFYCENIVDVSCTSCEQSQRCQGMLATK
mmetsp:Transcript_7073/g.10964  ORF Transcript_7073/g.10964 Transcript_7073/m.10964 type:complete len:87 (-) Transcript_7073:709-969(-)